MSNETRLRDRLDSWLTHPIATLAAGVSVITSSLGVFDPFALAAGLFGALGATADLWFPLLRVLTFLSPAIAWIPVGLTEDIFLVGAGLYGGYLAIPLVSRLSTRLKQEFKKS